MSRAPAIDTRQPAAGNARSVAIVPGDGRAWSRVGGGCADRRGSGSVAVARSPGDSLVVRLDVRREDASGHAPQRAGCPGAAPFVFADDACRDAIPRAAAA